MSLHFIEFYFDLSRRLIGYYSQEPVYVRSHDLTSNSGGVFRMAVPNIGEAPAKTFAE
jgi:hypothetical protein